MIRLSRVSSRAGVLAGVLLLLSCSKVPVEEASSGPYPEVAKPSNLVLLTVDTWRGDSLHHPGVSGLMPNLQGWASELALVAEDNSSVSSMTSPGLAGILTGLYPRRSGVLLNEHVLSPDLLTLPEIFRAKGFATAGFVGNPVVRPGMGFEQGFDVYELVPKSRPSRKAEGQDVVNRAIEWLAELPADQSFFIWIHLMDPHGPYEPSEASLAKVPVGSLASEAQEVPLLPAGDHSGWGGIPHYQWRSDLFPMEVDPETYRHRYQAEVVEVDQAFGTFRDYLKAEKLESSTLLVLAADHGEAMIDDHGFYFSHAHEPTQDQIFTPLLMGGAGVSAGRLEAPTSNLDVLPTLLSVFGISHEGPTDGMDLSSENGELASRFVVAQVGEVLMVRQGATKALVGPGERLRLTELPLEVVEDSPSSALPQGFRRELERLENLPVLSLPVDRFQLKEEERLELESLGYLEGDG